jgi:hypothetical protein
VVGQKKKMKTYSFRVRFHRSPVDTVNIDSPRWEWRLGNQLPTLLLCAHKPDTTIKDSEALVFKSEGWPSQEEAESASDRYSNALMLTLARLRIGADFGDRAPKSAFTRAGLAMIEAQNGCRVLNDVHGIMFYESDPAPRFVSFGANLLRGMSQDHFEKVFSQALANPRQLSPRDRLALELFNASFFQKTSDSRFLMLVMATETLIEPGPRSLVAADHVETLIRLTEGSEILSSEEKASLLGSLRWLRSESINQTGRKLAIARLGKRRYMEQSAPAFFSQCYSLRSRLVHGVHPFPTQAEVGNVVAQLEVFVSDLLSGELLEVQLS